MEYFVRDYGTGNEMPSPPQFVNYNTPDAIPSSASRPVTRPANFLRSSTRELMPREPIEPAQEEPTVNTAGVGAGGGHRQSMALDPAALSNHDGRTKNSVSPVNGQSQPYTNGIPPPAQANPAGSSSGWNVSRKPTAAATPPSHLPSDPLAEPIDPNAETFIKVGNNAYKVDLSRDPQQQQRNVPARSAPASPVKAASAIQQDGTMDPLQKQLQELQNTVSVTGSTRRNTLHRLSMAEQKAPAGSSTSGTIAAQTPGNPPKSLLPPGQAVSQGNRSPSPNRDYRNSADLVVGSHPSAPQASSRPPSPNPPTAAFMLPPNDAAQAPGTEMVSDVLADYQQSLPGERKSISRSNSNRGRPTSTQPQGHVPQRSGSSVNEAAQSNNLSHSQGLQRPSSGLGHVGVGAHGGSRSNSPLPQSRGPSPAPNLARNSLVSPSHHIARAPSPNSVGIALDPSGRVLHDELAQGYQRSVQAVRQGQPPAQHIQPLVQHVAPAPSPQQQAQRRSSYIPSIPPAAPVVAPVIAPPPAQQVYAVTPPPPPPANVYQQVPPPAAQPVYAPPPPAAHPTYTPPSQLYQQQRPPVAQQPVLGYQQPQQQAPAHAYSPVAQRNSTVMNGYYDAPPPPQPQQQQYQAPIQQQQQAPVMQPAYQQQPPPQQQQQQQWNRVPSPSPAPVVRRSPSPQPPQPTTEDGSTILFYGKLVSNNGFTVFAD